MKFSGAKNRIQKFCKFTPQIIFQILISNMIKNDQIFNTRPDIEKVVDDFN